VPEAINFRALGQNFQLKILESKDAISKKNKILELIFLSKGPKIYSFRHFVIVKSSTTHFSFKRLVPGGFNGPISVYRFPRRALTLCPQLSMGIQPGALLPARSADALPATLYGHFTQAIYRNRPIGFHRVKPAPPYR